MEWQPIETAPKDGTKVLLYGICNATNTPIHQVCCYEKTETYINGELIMQNESWKGWDLYGFIMGQTVSVPTHWMPLPGCPLTTEKE